MMKLKTKFGIGIISLGMITLCVMGVGIYWLVNKNPTSIIIKKPATLPEKTKDTLLQKLTPKIVWKKEFEHEIEYASMVTMPKGDSELPIIKVITTKDIFLFDKNGTMVRRLPARVGKGPEGEEFPSWVEISGNGEYVMEYLATGGSWLSNYRYTTWEGNILWERKNIYGDESYIVLTYITPQGDRIITVGDDGSSPESHPGIWFYNKKGKIIKGYSYKEIRYSEDGQVESIDGVGCGLSRDGKIFILVYRDTSQKGKFKVILFDKNGKILWKREIQRQVYGSVDRVDQICISSHSETVCVDIEDMIYIYNKKGDLIRQLKKRYGREYCQDIILSPKGDFLIMVFPSFIVLIDIDSGREIKRLNLEVQRSYESIIISPSNHLVAIEGKYKLYIITHQGNILYQEDMVGELGERGYIFSKDSRFLFMSIIKDKTISLYRMKVGGLKCKG